MINESFDNIFDASLIDYSKDFEKSDKNEYDKNRALEWIFTNCCDKYGFILKPENIQYNYEDKTVNILKGGLCMRGHNFGKIGKKWTHEKYSNEGEEISEIPEYVKFGTCVGSFDCGGNSLTTLRGCPKILLQDNGTYTSDGFYCENNKLTNLKYSPEYLDGDLYCSYNPIESTEGFPMSCIDFGWSFSCNVPAYNEICDMVAIYKKHNLEDEENEKRIIKKYYEKYHLKPFKYRHLNNLYESFDNIFDSSLIDYSGDFEKNDKISQIKNWIEKSTITHHINYVWSPLIYDKDYKINEDYTIDLFCDITILSPDRWYGVIDDLKNTYPAEFPEYINFNVCHGSFLFKQDSGIKSLRGCPKQVFGNFYCCGNSLKTLEGGPEIVSGNYNVCENKLISLKGSPKIIGDSQHDNFFNVYNNKLESLECGPEIVYGNYSVEKNKLKTLKGAPKSIWGQFNIKFNNNIPKEEFWDLMLSGMIEEWDLTPKQCELFGWKTTLYNKKKNKVKVNESLDDAFDSSLIDYSGDAQQSDERYIKTKNIAEWCARHVFKRNFYSSGSTGIYSGIPAKITINNDYSIDVWDDIYFDYMTYRNDCNEIKLPENIKFNIIHGSIMSEGDNWISFEGFPERVEGLLKISYIENLKTYKGFPKEVHSLEISSCPLNDLESYLPELCQNPNVDPDLSYISCKLFYSDDRIPTNKAKVKDTILYNALIKKYKKYKDSIEYIETDRCDTESSEWRLIKLDKMNESFDDAFDSSLLDYSNDFEESDKKQAIINWLESHVFDKRSSNSAALKYFFNEGSFDNSNHIYKLDISKNENNEYVIDIKGNIVLFLDPDNHEIPYKFNRVQGDFIIGYPGPKYDEEYNKKYQLHSLNNMPYQVGGDFNISSSKLDNLIGCPLVVEGDFLAHYCGLISIKGISNYITGDICITENDIQDSKEDFIKYLGENNIKNINQFHSNVFLQRNKTNLWNLGYDDLSISNHLCLRN